MIPIIIANMNPLKVSPPKTKMARSTISVVSEVLSVRLSVEFNAKFTFFP